MVKLLHTVLLNALPASGKSEARRYLGSLSGDDCMENFHMGETVQLDDYPYVHMMRRIDDILAAHGSSRIFFGAADKGFADGRQWGVLIHLVNDDYKDVLAFAAPAMTHSSYTRWLLERFDKAFEAVGIAAVFKTLPDSDIQAIEAGLEHEVVKLHEDKVAGIPTTLEGRTIVIEFARGGPHGSTYPLPGAHGYLYSYKELCKEILENAAVLYIWVTPEQSRAKNQARAIPDKKADSLLQSLHHGVPEWVMYNEYGTDDLAWLLEQSDRENCVKIEKEGKVYYIPVGRFDNREDFTTFARAPVSEWNPEDVKKIRGAMTEAFNQIWSQYEPMH
ncbi:hypothetical protein RCL1_001714 [Eukaryota sp. TZLM3-RCL]